MKVSERVRQWGGSFVHGGFAVALALLMVLLLRGIAVQISPVPELRLEPYPDVSTQELCEEAGGRWIESGSPMGRASVPVRPEKEDFQPYCQGPLQFEREQEAQLEENRQTSLFVFAVGGALAIIGGLLVVQLRVVAPGLLLGAIVSFFIATVHVWTLAPGLGRLVLIGIIFAALIGVGMYVFREKK
jgi:hypothetical protein